MTIKRTVGIAIWALTTAAPIVAANAADADWPHARGPRFDGRFPRDTPLAPSPADGPAVLWEQPLGQGFSGMVVAGGRVFTQHQKSSGQELVCFNLASGVEVWRTRYAFPWEMDGRYPGPYGTPTVADGRVYFSDCYGVIGCANVTDGALLWRFDAVKLLNPAGVDFGYAAAPLVMDGRVYMPAPAADAKLAGFCLDAATGALLWQAGNSIPSYAPFTPITLEGKACLLLSLRNGVALYDRQSGAELWKDEWTRGYDEHSCWPIYQEPHLFFPSAFRRGSKVYRLGWREGRVQADTLWEERVMSNDVLSSVLHEGHLYGFDVQSQQSELMGRTRGTLKCVDLASGAVRWTQTGIKHCSATLVGSRLLLLEDEGDLVLVDPSPEAYRELARRTLPQKGKIWAAPVIIGDRLLVRGSDSLVCYSLTTGAASASQAASKAKPGVKAANTPSLADNIHGWFERYRSDVFIAPSGRVLAEWYTFATALLGAALALGRIPLGSHRRLGWVAPATLLGCIGTFALTVATDRFTFTAPLSLFALFCAVVPACRDPRDTTVARGRGVGAILRLALFIALCYGYFRFCSGLFLVSGWGFLVGFPAVVLLALVWQHARLAPKIANRIAALLWPFLAFSAYYWTSAVAVVWSAK